MDPSTSTRLLTAFRVVLVISAPVVAWFTCVGAEVEQPIAAESIVHDGGHRFDAWIGHLPPLQMVPDSEEHPEVARARVFEDGVALGPAHSMHADVAELGSGAFSFWGQPRSVTLVFSSSDGSDPRSNGRRYTVPHRVYLPTWLCLLSLGATFVFACLPWLFPRVGDAPAPAPAEPDPPASEPAEPASERPPAQPAKTLAVSAGVTAVGVLLAVFTGNVLFWLGVAVFTIAGWVALATASVLVAEAIGRKARGSITAPLITILVSVFLFAMAFEGVLGLMEGRAAAGDGLRKASPAESAIEAALEKGFPPPVLLPDALSAEAQRTKVLTLPPEWELRHLPEDELPAGADRAYEWHAVLHVQDAAGFRRTTPFPPKQEGVCRVMFIGDSMTYGSGVLGKWAFPALVEGELSKRFRVEVLNLGIPGHQTRDILEILRTWGPQLDPDLVVYGICHNDFLPSGVGQDTDLLNYPFPLSAEVQAWLLERSRVLKFVSRGYDVALRAAGLRAQFYDHILAHFDDYAARVGEDFKAMNAEVTGRGLPPIVALVLDQFPEVGESPHWGVTQRAQELARDAGFDLIAADAYFEHFAGLKMMVSPWEGHPNETCHGLFAGLFCERLAAHPALAAYRISE